MTIDHGDSAVAAVHERNAALMLGFMEVMADAVAPGPTAPDVPVEVIRDLVFSRPDTAGDLCLDLYLPRHPPGPLPVIVWLPAGGWREMSRGRSPHLGRLFAQRGYAMADVAIRSTETAIWPAQLHDVKAAVRYLRSVAKEHGLDADRIGVWGDAAGGHLAALLGLTGDTTALEGDGGHAGYSSRVQAVVECAAPVDFFRMDEDALPDGVVYDVDAGSPIAALVGGTSSEQPQRTAEASPVNHVHPAASPFLILHGDRDRFIGPRQSERLFDALSAVGAEATLVLIEDVDHLVFATDAIERIPPLRTKVRSTLAGDPVVQHPGVLTAAMIERFFDRHLRRHFWC